MANHQPMFATDDSIVAIATPPGRGGIGVVRISGPASLNIAAAILDHRGALTPRYATYTRARRRADSNGAGALDEVIDRSEPATAEDRELLAQTAERPRIVVANKSDLPAAMDLATGVCVSARTGDGLDGLRRAIVYALTGAESLRDTAAISNARHIALVEQAREHLTAAQRAAARGDTPEEFVLADLQAARARLDEIVGARTSEDVLQHIFERFCIGK